MNAVFSRRLKLRGREPQQTLVPSTKTAKQPIQIVLPVYGVLTLMQLVLT